MRWFSKWVITVFASPIGVFVLAALDATVFVSLPFGIDAVVIILAARLRALWWVVPLLATAGSVVGAGLTFWMGRIIGEKGLERYVPPKRLERVRAKIKKSGAIALAILDLIPPPFPFTPFVLAAGALEVKTTLFFATLVICRLIRFGIEGALAQTYGRRVLALLDSDLFHDIVSFFILLAFVLTALSLVRLAQAARTPKQRAAA
jgi:membrane protein YqaA with SNARE-associated domain